MVHKVGKFVGHDVVNDEQRCVNEFPVHHYTS